jgi:CRP-like cAMP-binding protein
MKKSLFILGQLTDEDVDWIIDNGQREYIDNGYNIINQGKPIEVIYISLKGDFEVINETTQKTLAKVGNGEILGEMSYVNEDPPSATVKTVSECIVHSIPRAKINEKIDDDPEFGMRFYKAIATMLSHRLRHAQGGPDASGELDTSVLDKLHQAGARFERILKKFNINE